MRRLFLLLLLCIFLVSCERNSCEREYTADEMLQMQRELEEMQGVSQVNAETPCFWTQEGTVWHASRECPSLSKAEIIKQGKVTEAQKAGKMHGCKKCTAG